MKNTIVLFIIFAFYQNVMGEDSRWWQREKLKPSTNQIINPDYLSKKRELEIVWDQKNNALEAFRYFSSKGQNTSAIRKSVEDLEKQVQRLEQNLKHIPSYIVQKENNKTETLVIKNDSKKIDSIEALKTFGNKVMFKLDLSGWSTQKLIDFSNVFDTTEGAILFGVRILPQSYVMRIFKSLDDINKATGGAISWAKYTITFSKNVPKRWPKDPMERRPEILKLEEGLLKGEPVFIPLLYDGDEVSIRLPKGIHFLNYTVHMKFPIRNQPITNFGYCGNIEKCIVGPYFVEVKGNGQNAIIYSPEPNHIGFDKLNEYFARLEHLGVDSLILKSFSNISLEEEKKKNDNNKGKERKTETIYIRCLSCGKLNSEDAKFCHECGKRMMPNDSEKKK